MKRSKRCGAEQHAEKTEGSCQNMFRYNTGMEFSSWRCDHKAKPARRAVPKGTSTICTGRYLTVLIEDNVNGHFSTVAVDKDVGFARDRGPKAKSARGVRLLTSISVNS